MINYHYKEAFESALEIDGIKEWWNQLNPLVRLLYRYVYGPFQYTIGFIEGTIEVIKKVFGKG